MIILVVLLSTISISYAWAMRGTILGGERGALLPGAMLGLILAWASGSEVFTRSFWIISAVCACSMFFGGSQTYGQTIGMTHDLVNKSRRIRGRVGLTVKGALWFALAGGLTAMAFGAVAGEYTVWQIVLLVALMPAAKWLGFLLLNTPQKPKEGKFPAIYFSEGRFEIWGGLAFMVVELMVFQIAKGDWFALNMTIAGLISGGAGFLVGNIFQTGSSHRNKKGRYHFFGVIYEKGYIESWKLMEFTLGAFGGLGLSLCFCASYSTVRRYASQIVYGGGAWNPLGDSADKLAYIWIALVVLHALLYIVPAPKPWKKEIAEKLASGQISEERYDELMKTATDNKPPKIYSAVAWISENAVWTLYSFIPLLLSLLGSVLAAKLTVISVMLWALVDEIVFSKYLERFIHKKFVRVFSIAVSVAVLCIQLFSVFEVSMWTAWIFLCISYEIAQCFLMFGPKQASRDLAAAGGSVREMIFNYKAGLTIRGFSILCVIYMLIIGAIIFK